MTILDAYRLPKSMGGQTLGQLGQVDLTQKPFRRSAFAPAATMAQYYQSPEFQQYARPEDVYSTVGAESILGGVSTLGREAYQQAQQLGLGRGFAAQQFVNTRQQALSQLMGAITQGRLMGLSRRAAGAGLVAQAIREGQQALFLRNMQRRAAKRSQRQGLAGIGLQSLLGTLGLAGGAALGGALGGGPPGIPEGAAGAGAGMAQDVGRGIADVGSEFWRWI